MQPLVIEEDGFVDVQMGGATVKVDLYAVYNRLSDLAREAGEDAAKRNEATAAYVAELGFPRPSHRAAIAFTNGVFAAVGELEKKGQSPGSAGPTPGSPGTTDPPS